MTTRGATRERTKKETAMAAKQKAGMPSNKQWVMKTSTMSAYSTLMCCEPDDVSGFMLAELEREELADHKIYVTSPDDRLLALYSGTRTRNRSGRF